MSNLGTFSPQREVVRRVVDATPFARNVTPFIAVYGEGDVDARVVTKNSFAVTVAEDIKVRDPEIFIKWGWIGGLRVCRSRIHPIEGIVDPEDDKLARDARPLGHAHMFKV